MEMLLIELGSMTFGDYEVQIGDSYYFQFELDLPKLDAVEQGDITFEIFGLNRDVGLEGFHICDSHIFHLGDEVESTHPELYTDVQHATLDNVNKKNVIFLPGVHTDGYGSDVDLDGHIKLRFSTLATQDMRGATSYSINIGASFDLDEYIWLSQATLHSAADLTGDEFDYRVTMTDLPDTLKKGESTMGTFSVYLTEPVSDFSFSVKLPLGYTDVLHIGELQVETADSFKCVSSLIF